MRLIHIAIKNDISIHKKYINPFFENDDAKRLYFTVSLCFAYLLRLSINLYIFCIIKDIL